MIAGDVKTSKDLRFAAPLFADCTGDGTIGFLAGADFRMGRESREQTGESMAPETPDKMTMGASVQWYSVETDEPSPVPGMSLGAAIHGGKLRAAPRRRLGLGGGAQQRPDHRDRVDPRPFASRDLRQLGLPEELQQGQGQIRQSQAVAGSPTSRASASPAGCSATSS